jgi:hypothetical protein
VTDFPLGVRAVRSHPGICLTAVVAMTTLMAGCRSVRQPPPPEAGFKEVEAELDHFLCYFIDQKKTKAYAGTPAKLQDQFLTEPKPVNVGDHVVLCNPVEKKTTGSDGKEQTTKRNHADAHLLCYQLTADDVPKTVTISNQFDTAEHKISTTVANMLCVPSGKTKITQENPEPEKPKSPEEKDLDHFACYSLVDDHVDLKRKVHLEDQFVNDGFTVNTRRLLCNPVAKTVQDKEGLPKTTPRNHLDAHLVCYLLKDPNKTKDPNKKKIGAEKVVIHNQLEDKAVIETQSVAYLCVPSTKKG